MKLFAAFALALAGLVALTSSSTPPPRTQPNTVFLSFGVYQVDKATEMYKRFTPFLESLQDDVSKRLGSPCEISLSIFKTYDDAIEALVEGRVDFVHFGPASYVTAKERNPDVRLLAMEHDNGQKTFKGVIIVQKKSTIQTIADLRGKRFAFGDKNSTIGRYLVQAELVSNGVTAGDLAHYDYLDRHDRVASAVEHGDFDAGSVKTSTFTKANEKGTLRVLATFDNVTKPVVARAGLDPAVFKALQETLFACTNEAYFKSEKISGFTAASDDDYKLVREGMRKSAEFERGPASR
jgi:phosphonate transport system substrate-binding protein